MPGSRITCISAWECLYDRSKVHAKIELEDDRTKAELLSQEAMADLAYKLWCRFDPKTESFRPFFGGVAGWVWRKSYKEEAYEFEIPF